MNSDEYCIAALEHPICFYSGTIPLISEEVNQLLEGQRDCCPDVTASQKNHDNPLAQVGGFEEHTEEVSCYFYSTFPIGSMYGRLMLTLGVY